jgi:glycosyltransferase involved in cell wall biosynthesis
MHIWQLDPVNLTPYYDRAICQALAEQSHTIRFITSRYLYDDLSYPKTFKTEFDYFRWLDSPRWLKFPRLRKIFRALAYPLPHWQLLRKIKKERPDIVHFQWSRFPVFDRWLVRQIQRLGIPVVHTIHDVSPIFALGKFTGDVADVYTCVDALIVHTEDSRQQLLSLYPTIDPARVSIIPLIPDKAPDSKDIPADASMERARQQLGIPAETTVMLFFGTVKYYKGLDLLAAALPKVEAQLKNYQIWIVGHPDSPKDIALLSELAQRPHVVVRADYVPTEEMWLYYFASDVVLFPYHLIFQSAALMTALVHGRAAIVTRVGGLPEMIDENGWIVPAEDPEAFANAMIEAAHNRDQLHKMGQRSQELVAERFSASHIAQQHSEVYRTLLKKTRRD